MQKLFLPQKSAPQGRPTDRPGGAVVLSDSGFSGSSNNVHRNISYYYEDTYRQMRDNQEMADRMAQQMRQLNQLRWE